MSFYWGDAEIMDMDDIIQDKLVEYSEKKAKRQYLGNLQFKGYSRGRRDSTGVSKELKSQRTNTEMREICMEAKGASFAEERD